ncbi:hypothetical protein [Paracoccus litorisediminis]|uniref:Uncharacterized protein n=1 Tax=Paracoccus litorisediminis TaxID=2006130 RepID=A0A844HUA9_9RHOB|nr:hypothetical protein [Paracoccus litorisediminis]MTH61161.1 hypothetical protein [Paracoccus litorisediminis]
MNMLQLVGAIMVAWVIFSMIASIYNASGVGRDDSDPATGTRSGMRVHTDHLTGIQYLSGPKGGLMMRVDTEGRPILAKEVG